MKFEPDGVHNPRLAAHLVLDPPTRVHTLHVQRKNYEIKRNHTTAHCIRSSFHSMRKETNVYREGTAIESPYS